MTLVECWFWLITSAMLGAMIWVARFPAIHWIFTWPATVMHELAHFVVAMITFGQPKAISLLPKRTKSGVRLGQVTVGNLNAFNGALIAMAPLFLLGVAFALYTILIRDHSCDWTKLVPMAYLVANSVYGSVPSRSDVLQALRKPFGGIAIIAVAAIFFVGQTDAMAVGLIDYGKFLAKQAGIVNIDVRAASDHAGLSIVKNLVYWTLPDNVLVDVSLFLALLGVLTFLLGFRRIGISLLLFAAGCWLIPILLEPYIEQIVALALQKGVLIAKRLPWWALVLACGIGCIGALRLVLTIFIGRSGANQAMSILIADIVRLFCRLVFVLPFRLIGMIWRSLNRNSTQGANKT